MHRKSKTRNERQKNEPIHESLDESCEEKVNTNRDLSISHGDQNILYKKLK